MTHSANDGELNLGMIMFEGKAYQFVDPDGNGEMDWGEASSQGMPEALFKCVVMCLCTCAYLHQIGAS